MPYLETSTGSDAVLQPAIMADHLHPPVEVAVVQRIAIMRVFLARWMGSHPHASGEILG